MSLQNNIKLELNAILLKKRPWAHVFFCQFSKNFENTLFKEHLWIAAFEATTETV